MSPDSQTPRTGSSSHLLSLLMTYQQRAECYCGKPRGHAGWLVCVTDKAWEDEHAA